MAKSKRIIFTSPSGEVSGVVRVGAERFFFISRGTVQELPDHWTYIELIRIHKRAGRSIKVYSTTMDERQPGDFTLKEWPVVRVHAELIKCPAHELWKQISRPQPVEVRHVNG